MGKGTHNWPSCWPVCRHCLQRIFSYILCCLIFHFFNVVKNQITYSVRNNYNQSLVIISLIFPKQITCYPQTQKPQRQKYVTRIFMGFRLHQTVKCRRKCQPTPLFLTEEPHGQRNLLGYIVHGFCTESDTTEVT